MSPLRLVALEFYTASLLFTVYDHDPFKVSSVHVRVCIVLVLNYFFIRLKCLTVVHESSLV